MEPPFQKWGQAVEVLGSSRGSQHIQCKIPFEFVFEHILLTKFHLQEKSGGGGEIITWVTPCQKVEGIFIHYPSWISAPAMYIVAMVAYMYGKSVFK